MVAIACTAKIIYKVVKESKPDDLQNHVIGLLADGWQLQGGVSTACVPTGYGGGANWSYCQALTKECYFDLEGNEIK